MTNLDLLRFHLLTFNFRLSLSSTKRDNDLQLLSISFEYFWLDEFNVQRIATKESLDDLTKEMEKEIWSKCKPIWLLSQLMECLTAIAREKAVN